MPSRRRFVPPRPGTQNPRPPVGQTPPIIQRPYPGQRPGGQGQPQRPQGQNPRPPVGQTPPFPSPPIPGNRPRPGAGVGGTTGTTVVGEVPGGAPGGDVVGVQQFLDAMPLDPRFEAIRRALEANLQAELAGVNPAREALGAEKNVALARMATDEERAKRAAMENLAARGLATSPIAGVPLGELATEAARNRQDLAAAIAEALGGISQAEAGAYGDYQAGLAEALLQSGQESALSQYTPTPRPAPNPKTPKRNRGQRTVRRNRAGGRNR
jgi:hypothetical protein